MALPWRDGCRCVLNCLPHMEPPTPDTLSNVYLLQTTETNKKRGSGRGGGVGGSVWTWELIGQSLALFLCWFTATLVYYGLGFSAGDMAGGLYANSIALSAVDVPGNLLYALLADRPFWGRRRTQAMLFGVAGLYSRRRDCHFDGTPLYLCQVFQ